MKKLNTYIAITYKKNGNIDKLVSIFDNDVTSKPLNIAYKFKKVHSSYTPLTQNEFNQWSNKHC